MYSVIALEGQMASGVRTAGDAGVLPPLSGTARASHRMKPTGASGSPETGVTAAAGATGGSRQP